MCRARSGCMEVFMLIKSLPEDSRPLEKARKRGVGTLSDAELIALIIRTGVTGRSSVNLAEDVLAVLDDGLYELGDAQPEDLTAVKGIGERKAYMILAAVELGKRISASKAPLRYKIDNWEDAAALFMEELRHEKKEYFKSVIMDVRGRVLSVDDVSCGELTGTIVHPREVFRRAVRKSASGVLFVHNHPSGDPQPSRKDIDSTKRLMEAGELLGIQVIDHIIIGDGEASSMKQLGYI